MVNIWTVELTFAQILSSNACILSCFFATFFARLQISYFQIFYKMTEPKLKSQPAYAKPTSRHLHSGHPSSCSPWSSDLKGGHLQNLNLPNTTKSNLPNQIKPTKPNLPNPTYQTKPTKPNITYQIKPTNSKTVII